jgi:hypothetical protein
MPFTLAHPAAILPLRHSPQLRTVALMIGAMIPDLPYYLPARSGLSGPATHTLVASFTTCLVLGYAALAALFVLRRPLTALLTARSRWLCQSALAPWRTGVRVWLLAAPAIVLGVWTHLLWDSFTHNDGWVVHRVSALSAPVDFGPFHATVCHLLQYVSSVAGLAVLILWYWRLPVPHRSPGARGAPRSAVGPVLLLAAAAALLIGGVQAMQAYGRIPSLYYTIDIFLTRSLAWFALLYLVAGTVVTLEHHGEVPRV